MPATTTYQQLQNSSVQKVCNGRKGESEMGQLILLRQEVLGTLGACEREVVPRAAFRRRRH